MPLKNKTALITGAGRGLGRATAVAMAKEGAFTALLSRTKSELEETAAFVARDGGQALVLVGDVADEHFVRESVALTIKELGQISILVNNAATTGPAAPVHEVDPDDWERTMAVNLNGARLAIQEVIPHMIERGGRIINVTSGLAQIAMPMFGAYSVSKAGLDHMTRIMALELAGFDIQVNGLDPGVMDTAMQEDIRALGPEVLGKPLHDQFMSFKEAGSLGSPDDVAKLAVFLASEHSVGISGEIGGAAEFREYGYGLSED